MKIISLIESCLYFLILDSIINSEFIQILSGKIMIQEIIVYSIIAVFIGISQVIIEPFRVLELVEVPF
jgi:hypothetical protein